MAESISILETYKWFDNRVEQENRRYNERWDRFLRIVPAAGVPVFYIVAGIVFKNLPGFGAINAPQEITYLKIAGTALLVAIAALSFGVWRNMKLAIESIFELDEAWRAVKKRNPEAEDLPDLKGGANRLPFPLLPTELAIPLWSAIGCLVVTVTIWFL